MIKILLFIAFCTCHANADSFFVNDVGKLHLTEQKWEIQYVLNLTEYTETSEILHECINGLKTVCRDGKNPLCAYFEHATENINTAIEADNARLHTLNRSKRFIVFIPIVLGVTVVAFWAGMTTAKSAINSIKDEMRENLDVIEQAANLTISTLNTMEKFAEDNDKNILKLQEAINNNTKNIELQTRFFNIINVISFSTQMHEKMQIKLNDIYYGDIESRLFEVIDIGEFLSVKTKINKQLGPNLTLPNITSTLQNKFIRAYTNFNNTHLTLSIHLPVIRKSSHNISEIIPLPIQENNTTFILDMPTTTYFKNGSRIQLFPDDKTKKSLCKTQNKKTICNTLLEDYAVNATICLNNLLKNNSDEGCVYKKIAYKNYFIQISDQQLYIHLIHPIKLVMDCKTGVYAINMIESSKVWIPSGCAVYKYTDKHYNGKIVNKFDIPQHKLYSEINFSNMSEDKKVSFLPLYDKYKLQLIESKEKAIRFKKSIPLKREKIEDITITDLTPDFGLYNFLSNSITQYLIYGIAIILILMIVKALTMKLLTKWKI